MYVCAGAQDCGRAHHVRQGREELGPGWDRPLQRETRDNYLQQIEPHPTLLGEAKCALLKTVPSQFRG